MIQPEIVIVPLAFLIPSSVVVVRMWLRHKEKMATLTGATTNNAAVESRLARIEDAIETIALEVERMGEGQRFVTKLLADRAAPALPESPKSAAGGTGGRVVTPH